MDSTAETQPTIQVIATTFDGTRAALATAVPLARGAGARLALVVPRIVPFPIEIDDPVDSTSMLVERYCGVIEELGSEARVSVCLCRRIDDLVSRLDTDRATTVVVGGAASGRWFASPEARFAAHLGRAGRRVIYVASGPPRTSRHEPIGLG